MPIVRKPTKKGETIFAITERELSEAGMQPGDFINKIIKPGKIEFSITKGGRGI